MLIFAIFDSKADAFLQPFFSPTNATALRSFATAANDQATDFHRYAADYTLFQLGAWDANTGTITVHEAKQPLGCALEYITTNEVTALHAVEE